MGDDFPAASSTRTRLLVEAQGPETTQVGILKLKLASEALTQLSLDP
jgi:hypothetical protein